MLLCTPMYPYSSSGSHGGDQGCHGAPMVLQWCSNVLLCAPMCSHVLPWCSHGAPMVLPWWLPWWLTSWLLSQPSILTKSFKLPRHFLNRLQNTLEMNTQLSGCFPSQSRRRSTRRIKSPSSQTTLLVIKCPIMRYHFIFDSKTLAQDLA